MSEKKPEKKVVSRTVAIAIGIVCIILVASLIGATMRIISYMNQVNDLNRIVNFQKTVFWLNNNTININPNQNVTENFYAPLSGNVKVVGYVNPPTSGIWTNLTWWVAYGSTFTPTYSYHSSPSPYVDNWFSNYFEEEYPITSFPQGYPTTVMFEIGNRGTEPVTVNLTITLTY
jgi:hypothetical protein